MKDDNEQMRWDELKAESLLCPPIFIELLALSTISHGIIHNT